VGLAQDGAFAQIHVRQVDAQASASDEPATTGGELVLG
jgi:hypothetical protein